MTTKQSGKILRIGVIQGGRIIEERFFRKRETITVGESPRCTFILPFSELPIPKLYPLFVVKNNRYELQYNKAISGKISVGSDVADLGQLASSGKAKSKGNAFLVSLDDTMRGKVTIGEVTILFQFVQAPPLPAKPKLPSSIRGGWVKSIDWVYVGVLFTSFIMHAGLFGYASTYPIPKTVALDMVAERFAKIIATDMPKMEKEEVTLEGEGEGAKKEEDAKPKGDKKKEDAGKAKKEMSAQERAEAAARRKAEIAKKVAGAGLVALLTAKGPAGEGGMVALADTLSEGGRFGNIDDMMQGVTGLGIAEKATERGRRGGGGGGPESKEISNVGVGEGGKADLAGRAEKTIKASASLGSLDVDGALDSSAIKRVVKRNLPSIKHCYEQELRRNPKLAGKVTVEFTVAVTGAISGTEVVSSSLNNRAVEGCIVKTIRRWRFPKPEDGDVIITYPFIFQASR